MTEQTDGTVNDPPSDIDVENLDDLTRIVERLSADEIAAVSRRFDHIPALPKSDAAVWDLVAGMSAVSSLPPEAAFQLLLVIGDTEWFDKLPTPLSPAVERRLRRWQRLYGPSIEHLLDLDNLPDDWHRILVSVVRLISRDGEDVRVRLQLHKTRGDDHTFEMTPSSYLQLCVSLLEELSNLPDDVVREIDGDDREAFRVQVDRAAAKLSVRAEK